jgi:hypothetical protein
VLRKWVSRFDLWPYVERFALDCERELRAELGEAPFWGIEPLLEGLPFFVGFSGLFKEWGGAREGFGPGSPGQSCHASARALCGGGMAIDLSESMGAGKACEQS